MVEWPRSLEYIDGEDDDIDDGDDDVDDSDDDHHAVGASDMSAESVPHVHCSSTLAATYSCSS